LRLTVHPDELSTLVYYAVLTSNCRWIPCL